LGDYTETGKGLAQIRIGDAVRKVAYVDVRICLSLLFRALVRFDTIEKHQAHEFLRQENAVYRHGEVRGYESRGEIGGISSK